MSVEIIAEAGSNHNGDLNTACRLIQAAADAGATTIKFQHYPDQRYGPHPMPERWLPVLEQRAQEQAIGFLCSVFDHQTLDQYATLITVDRVKIASPELTHHDLIREAAERFGTVILSTGMSKPSQIEHAVQSIYLRGSTPITLHCVSSYPTPPQDMHLRALRYLHPSARYGLSDHTLHPTVAPVAAVVLKACIIEKHLTLDKTQDGPDHSYALDPDEFSQMCYAIRLVEEMLGEPQKRIQPSEDPANEWRRLPA